MISLMISLLIIFLVFAYCDSLFDMIIVFGLIILFICLVRDWTLQEFFVNFIEMFRPIVNWLESHNIKFKN